MFSLIRDLSMWNDHEKIFHIQEDDYWEFHLATEKQNYKQMKHPWTYVHKKNWIWMRIFHETNTLDKLYSNESWPFTKYKSEQTNHDIQRNQSLFAESTNQSFDLLDSISIDRIIYLQLSAKFSLSVLFTQSFGPPSGFYALLLLCSLCVSAFLSAQRQVLIALLFLWCLLCAGFSLEIIC